MTSLPTDPAPIDATLHQLVDVLLDDLVAGDLPPALLHVTAGDAEGFDLGILPLDGRHPTDLLIGTIAPAEWHALGMACQGWAYRMSARSRTDRRRTRAHIVALVSRSGEVAHRTCVEDAEDVGVDTDRLDDDAPVGEQVDLLRRAMALPTEPPPCDTSVYWAIRWLSEILAVPAAALRNWSSLVDLHPAIVMLRRSPADAERIIGADGDLTAIARSFARVLDWSQLRTMLHDGRFETDELVGSDAAWFDDGSFARFVLNRCPPLAMLRREAAAHLPTAAAEELAAVLASLGVPESSWPDADRAARVGQVSPGRRAAARASRWRPRDRGSR